jgi:hypothetical protein
VAAVVILGLAFGFLIGGLVHRESGARDCR